MIKDISGLKTNQALLQLKQEQTDTVIRELRDNLKSLSSNVVQFEGKVTKGFYIACGVALVASGSVEGLLKTVVKFVGG